MIAPDDLPERFRAAAKRSGLYCADTILERAIEDRLMRELVWLYMERQEDPVVTAWCAMMMGFRMGERP